MNEPAWVSEEVIEDRSFRIVDLVGRRIPILRNRTFRRCTIYGPAVLGVMSDNSFSLCRFDGTESELLWEIDPEVRPSVAGVIGVDGCTFEECHFQGVGFAGAPSFIGSFKSGIEFK